jgi:mono/diheme cytochrome c family protein
MHHDRFRSAQALRRRSAAMAAVAAGLALLAGLLAGPMAPALAHPAGQSGPDGQAIFQAGCAACHTIGQGAGRPRPGM